MRRYVSSTLGGTLCYSVPGVRVRMFPVCCVYRFAQCLWRVVVVLLCTAAVVTRVQADDAVATEGWYGKIPLAVYLTRFAARHLYAPPRLALQDASLRFVSPEKTRVCRLVQGVDWLYTALGAWRGYEHWVEAVLVRNRSDLRIPLDPRIFDHGRIRGHWIATTFQHRWLEPAGSTGDADGSVLYLVSKHRRKHRCEQRVAE